MSDGIQTTPGRMTGRLHEIETMETNCKRWLAGDADAAVYPSHRADALAGKPAPKGFSVSCQSCIRPNCPDWKSANA